MANDVTFDPRDSRVGRYVHERNHSAWLVPLWPGRKRRYWTGAKDYFIGAPRAFISYTNDRRPLLSAAPRHTLRLTIRGFTLQASW